MTLHRSCILSVQLLETRNLHANYFVNPCRVSPVTLHGVASPKHQEPTHAPNRGDYDSQVATRLVCSYRSRCIEGYGLLGVEYDPLASSGTGYPPLKGYPRPAVRAVLRPGSSRNTIRKTFASPMPKSNSHVGRDPSRRSTCHATSGQGNWSTRIPNHLPWPRRGHPLFSHSPSHAR